MNTGLLDRSLVPIYEAAAALGISEKRLLGHCLSPLPWAPISDGVSVYGWSCRALAERMAASAGDSAGVIS